MHKRSQEQYDEWFHWKDPAQDPHFQAEPQYANPETRIVVDWMKSNPARMAKLTKWIRKRFSQTYDIEGAHTELVEKLKSELWDFADKLGAPYSELLYYALVNIEWDAVAGLVTADMGWAPTTQPAEEHLEKALGLLPETAEPEPTPEPRPVARPQPPVETPVTTTPSWEFSPNFT